MPNIKTYLDSCVLITAFNGTEENSAKAFQILDDPNRQFVISDFTKLELLIKPTFHKNKDELEFMQAYIDCAVEKVEPSAELIAKALDLGFKYNLKSIDAVHVSATLTSNADQLVTFEGPNQPMNRVTEVEVLNLTIT